MRNPRLKLSRTAIYVAAILASLSLPLAAETKQAVVVPTDGLKITSDTTFVPGTYVLEHGVEIAADGVTLDGGGAVLIGKDFTGSAVRATGRSKIAVKNLKIERYYHGIRLEDCRDITVESNTVTKTAEVEFGKNWLDIWAKPADAYGAAVILLNVRGGRVASNDLQHQQNGVSMYSCSGLTIEKNNASYESGWGIHLNNSSDNIIQDNLADFCNRVHFRDHGDYVGADATGLLMVVNCCRNKVLRNFFRGGGDGVFIAGYHGDKMPCNNNVFEENDCSLSPNNAFESTFCEGNIFRKNKANGSNYGFWLGYSWKNEVTDNEVAGNRFAGIAIEHGNNNLISKNTIRNNRHGIMLWVSGDGFAEDYPEMADSHSYTITDNRIEGNRIGINSTTTHAGKAHCRGYTITGNTITDNRTGIRLERTNDCRIEANRMSANASGDIKQVECAGNTVKNNTKAEPPNEDPDVASLPWDVRR